MRSLFITMFIVTALALLWGDPLRPLPADASFHIAEINELMIGVNGDPSVQYIEINERSLGQNLVSNTRLVAFGPTGNYLGVVLQIPNNVANSGDGVRWLMGTPAFELASGIQADFEFAPGILSPTAGMVCWGASSGESNPNSHVDCLAYGNYPGTLPSETPAEGPSALSPGDCQRSLTRTVPATFGGASPPSDTWADGNNATDFALAAATPKNNAGMTGSFTFTDTDGDTIADCRDPDIDGDGASNVADNCPLTANSTQDDADLDALGDVCEASFGTNPNDLDTDDDGCADGREVRTLTFAPNMGGDRDPLSPWDFFDVPLPALTVSNPSGTRNRVVLLADAVGVVYYVGTSDNGLPNANGVDYDTDLNGNGVEDGREYDRSPSTTPGKPWKSNAPNGAVTLSDALVAVNQVGHSCAGSP